MDGVGGGAGEAVASQGLLPLPQGQGSQLMPGASPLPQPPLALRLARPPWVINICIDSQCPRPKPPLQAALGGGAAGWNLLKALQTHSWTLKALGQLGATAPRAKNFSGIHPEKLEEGQEQGQGAGRSLSFPKSWPLLPDTLSHPVPVREPSLCSSLCLTSILPAEAKVALLLSLLREKRDCGSWPVHPYPIKMSLSETPTPSVLH